MSSPRAVPFAFFAFSSAIALGCGHVSTENYQAMSAGAIGCPKNEVVIRDQTNTVTSVSDMTWSADCRGHHYICSYAGNTNCKEELAPLTVAGQPGPPAGSAVDSGAALTGDAGISL